MVESRTGLKEFKEITCISIDALDAVAREIIDFAGNIKIWTFNGEMGAGKTTLIKSICKLFGVKDSVSSPTYSLVNEYVYGPTNKIFHFDFYRINSESEALDIGFEDYIYTRQYCFIEWPSKVSSLLPAFILEI